MNLAELRTHTPILNKKKEKKGRKPIKKVAKKRAAINREYMKLRAQFLTDHPYCQWYIMENLMPLGHTMEKAEKLGDRYWTSIPFATEIHHKKGRGKFMLNTSTWLAVSSEGHKAIHADPKTSYAKGYMLPRR